LLFCFFLSFSRVSFRFFFSLTTWLSMAPSNLQSGLRSAPVQSQVYACTLRRPISSLDMHSPNRLSAEMQHRPILSFPYVSYRFLTFPNDSLRFLPIPYVSLRFPPHRCTGALHRWGCTAAPLLHCRTIAAAPVLPPHRCTGALHRSCCTAARFLPIPYVSLRFPPHRCTGALHRWGTEPLLAPHRCTGALHRWGTKTEFAPSYGPLLAPHRCTGALHRLGTKTFLTNSSRA